MMSRLPIGIALIMLVVGNAGASEVVSPKTVLEIQPFMWDLSSDFDDGSLFAGDANKVLTDSTYLWDSFLSDEQVIDVADIKPRLEVGHGILLYGTHGGVGGLIGIEWAADLPAANARKAYLTQALFQPDEIEVGVSQTGVWMICLTSVYTNFRPGGCDVAIIANCWGSSGGSFNATHRLAGAGSVTNVAHHDAYATLMLYMMNGSVPAFVEKGDGVVSG